MRRIGLIAPPSNICLIIPFRLITSVAGGIAVNFPANH